MSTSQPALRQLCAGLLASNLLFAALPGQAESPQQILANYTDSARQQTVGFTSSASRGQRFFAARHGQDWSCASCHTTKPDEAGKHVVTGKIIQPMSTTANAERFTRPDKVEKWFGRNCKDVLGRECTPAEKADVVAFLTHPNR